MSKYVELAKPPVAVALFQLKFNSANIRIDNFGICDPGLRKKFPFRKDNVSVGINLQNASIPLGKSDIKGTSDVRIRSFIYTTKEQKEKLEISEGTITYIDERKYTGWENFKKYVVDALSLLSDVLNNIEVYRVSIRFINKFELPDFSTPQEYVTTVITNSTGNTIYPIRQYGFRLQYDIPDTNIYAIVNQNVEKDPNDKYAYVLDIDVLDRQSILFQLDTIADNLEKIRDVKNDLFFESITQKTIDLCR